MANEFQRFAEDVISARAVAEHEAKCADPDNCSDWHIRNDYMPRIRRQVLSEMMDAVHVLKVTG